MLRWDRKQAAITAFAIFALRSRDIAETARRGVIALTDALGADVGVLVRVTGPGRVVVAAARGAGHLVPGQEVQIEPGLLAAGASRGPLWPDGPQVALSLPVTVEGRPWGRFAAGPVPEGTLPDDDVDTVSAIAALFGAAVERDLLQTRQAALAGLAAHALRARDIGSVMERTVTTVTQLTGVSVAAVVRAASGPPSTLIVVQSAVAAHLATGRRPEPGVRYPVSPELDRALHTSGGLVVPDCARDARFVTPVLPGPVVPGACLVCPVSSDGRIWGWVIAGDDEPRPFSPGETEAAVAAAGVLGEALARRRREWERAGAVLATAATPADAAGTSDGEAEVALLNPDGVIVWVNRAWRAFASANGGDPSRTGVGMSYLAACDAAGSDPAAQAIADAVRCALAGDLPAPMTLLLPCHGPRGERWFDVLVSSRLTDEGTCLGAVVSLAPSR